MGLLLGVHVSPANVPDREGAKPLLTGLATRFHHMALVWADQGYDGAPFAEWVKEHAGCRLEIVSREQQTLWSKDGEKAPPLKGFVVLARRWVVERTIAWICRNRRLSKDYEGLPKTGEALVAMAMVYLMLKRLTR